MHLTSSLISKVAKAKQYSNEPERMQFQDFTMTVRGDNDTHTVTFRDGHWSCGCHSFEDNGLCAHTMAVERLLGITVPPQYRLGNPLLDDEYHHII